MKDFIQLLIILGIILGMAQYLKIYSIKRDKKKKIENKIGTGTIYTNLPDELIISQIETFNGQH